MSSAKQQNDHLCATGSQELTALFNAATPNLYRENAFRITGLTVDSTAREIAKYLDQLRIREELGQLDPARRGAFPLKPPPSIQTIRESEQKLRNPDLRIIDELFWFWPVDQDNGKEDLALAALSGGDTKTADGIWATLETHPTKGVAAAHNLAVRWHMAALGLERRQASAEAPPPDKLEKHWQTALKRWDRLARDDAFWAAVAKRIRRLDDPRLTPDFLGQLRAHFSLSLANVNVTLLLDHTEADERPYAEIHKRLIWQSPLLLDDPKRLPQLVFDATKVRIREHLNKAKRQAESAPEQADMAARELIKQIGRYDDLLLALCDFQDERSSSRLDDLNDGAASVITDCLVDYQQKTSDNQTFVDLLEQALLIAISTSVRDRIKKNIKIGRDNLAQTLAVPILDALQKIIAAQERPKVGLTRFLREIAPLVVSLQAELNRFPESQAEVRDSLSAFLRGISVDAWNKEHDAITAHSALKLALEYAQDSTLQTKLREDYAALDALISKRNGEKRKRYWKWGAAAAVLGLIILNANGVFDSPKSPSKGVSNTTISATSSSTESTANGAPVNQQQSIDGATYRVPSSMSAELDQEARAIDQEKARAAILESQLNNAKQVIEAARSQAEAVENQAQVLGQKIDYQRAVVSDSDQASVDEFNRQVRQYNSLARRARESRSKVTLRS